MTMQQKSSMIDLFAINLDQPQLTLARWWSELNHWKFPAELIDLQPEGWNTWTIDQMHDFIRPLMHELRARVPKKELMRYHWRVNIARTDAEFEEWWVDENGYWNRRIGIST